MGRALYRKYRSKNLAEIVGQEHITKSLDNALKSGKISHAYLFTGPRGVGKTSIARILAHEVNDLPYEEDSSYVDIIEIDAASNRSIEEIRDLRDKVNITPSRSKYKVYIIDEVHMLTTYAFNALLKTLEEPPEHVIFILATTDVHKLPETIISRTQRYNFKSVEKSKVIDHLSSIAKSEKIDIDQEALDLIARLGEGSFRDSISMLDQLSSKGTKIIADDVRELLGSPSQAVISNLVDGLDNLNSSYKEVIEKIEELVVSGITPASIANSLMEEIRNRIINNNFKNLGPESQKLLFSLINVSSSNDPKSYLEFIVIDYLSSFNRQETESIKIVETITEKPKPIQPKVVREEPLDDKPKVDAVKEVAIKPKTIIGPVDVETEKIWPDVLDELKTKYNTLYGIIRMAKPTITDSNIVLEFKFAFHQKRVNDPRNLKILSDIVHKLTGKSLPIVCELNKEIVVEKVADTENDDEKLKAINDIFGSSEIVE